jgi:hypothetical protein
MGVVFDEVVANVDAPRASEQNEDRPQQAQKDLNEHDVIQIVEAEKRRLLRLQAD